MKSYIAFFIAFACLPLSLVLGQTKPDSSTVLYGWTLDAYTVPKLDDIDTLLPDVQIHNPLFRSSLSNSYLGNFGSPAISNIFIDRRRQGNFFLMDAYLPYLATYDKAKFYNSKTPFSHLFYTNANSKRDKEETLQVFLTQNVSPNVNFGFKYDLIASKGQYRYLDVKSNVFNVFSSYTGKQYQLHAVLDINRYKASESSGVNDSIFRYGDYRFNKEIDTRFGGTGDPKYTPNATNKIRYMDWMVSNRLKLFQIGGSTDDSLSTASGSFGEPIVSFVTRGSRVSKIYEDKDPLGPEYYNRVYANMDETYDSISSFDFTNTLQLEFKSYLKQKHLFGFYASLNQEYQEINYYSLTDSATFKGEGLSWQADSIRNIDKLKAYNSWYLAGGIYGKLWKTFESEFNAYLFFAGDKAGETRIDGTLRTTINKEKWPLEAVAKGSIENSYPEYMYQNFYSNHYFWEDKNNQSSTTVNLSGSVYAPSNKFKVYADYSLLSRNIYFDSVRVNDTLSVFEPMQNTGAEISVLSIGLSKEFKFWKFRSENKFLFQTSSNTDIVSIPRFVFFNSTYFDNTWHFKTTGGWLRTMVGFDIYYNANFEGYSYVPALSTFYHHSDYTVGQLPVIDAFINIRIKRARVFFKFENLNTEIFDSKDYYSTALYPLNDFVVKYGVSWTFYD